MLNLLAMILSVAGLLFCITNENFSKTMLICQVIIKFTQETNQHNLSIL